MRYEPALVQELVVQEARRDRAYYALLMAKLEPVYELPEGERGAGFNQVYQDQFQERRLGQPVEEVLAEFPALAGVEEVLVFRALSPTQEGGELGKEGQKIGLRLRVQHFSLPEELKAFLRHELMHLSDMLDPGFGYKWERVGQTPAEEHLIHQRYGVLWDSYIDGRLSRQGRGTIASREERLRDFERCYSFLPLRERRAAFLSLWERENLTHPQLLEMAQRPSALVGEVGELPEEVVNLRLPGALCPLCRFPTYKWGDLSAERVAPAINLIKAAFPWWDTATGACERCLELYQVKAGVW